MQRRVCRPAYCIADLESLCRSVLNDHLVAGVKKRGRISGPTSPLTLSQYDDALVFLIGAGWELAQRFNGRGRLAGFVQSFLFMGIVDWRRQTFGSSRYGPVPVFTSTATPEADRAEAWLDPEFDDGSVLDRREMSAETLEAFELVWPLVDEPLLTHGDLAARGGVTTGRVARAATRGWPRCG